MSKYYVSHHEQQMGPYSVDEIVNLVSQGTLSPLDYIYDPSHGDWLLFLDHAQLAEKVKQLKPKTAPKPAPHSSQAGDLEDSQSQEDSSADRKAPGIEWFVLKGENKFGPFAYADIISMLQERTVYEFDFVWHSKMEGWSRIAELPEFAVETMKKMKASGDKQISNLFFRRRHRRVKYNGSILIHDHKKVWRGHGIEISEGGAGVVMDNATVVPGQKLYLHFKPGDGVPHFNAMCEVVSKQYVPNLKDATSPVKYGLKFLAISSEAEKFLRSFTKEASAA